MSGHEGLARFSKCLQSAFADPRKCLWRPKAGLWGGTKMLLLRLDEPSEYVVGCYMTSTEAQELALADLSDAQKAGLSDAVRELLGSALVIVRARSRTGSAHAWVEAGECRAELTQLATLLGYQVTWSHKDPAAIKLSWSSGLLTS